MAVARSRPVKTVDDYMSLPEGVRAELLCGEIYVSPSPLLRHQAVSRSLFVLLHEFVSARGLGEVHFAPLDVHLPSGDIVQPDVIYVSESNRGILQDWIRGVPDLLVEVVPPQNAERDRIVKRTLYARNGVREYWIVDPESRTVEVLAPAGDQYEPFAYGDEAGTVTSSVLIDLVLPVASVTEG